MSGKTFVGNRASSLKESDKLQPYTKVTVTDGTNSYSSGTDTGRELLVEVPVLPNGDGATLAANILNSVKNYQYRPYEADSALLDPAAELGDGITVGGVYGGIHAKTTTFSRLFRANVSAPAEEEIDSEYPYLSAQERDAVRQKKQTAKNTADIAQNTTDIAGNTASIGTLNTKVANVETLVAGKATIAYVDAEIADVTTLVAEKATVAYVDTEIADVEKLVANKVSANYVDAQISAAVQTLTSELTVTTSISAPSAYFTNLSVNSSSFKPKIITYKNGSGVTSSMTVLGV